MELIIGIVATLVGAILAYTYIKFVKKWVDVKDIPEEEIARVADKIIGKKIDLAEKEIEENKKSSEERLREMRKETQSMKSY